ncbi:MAG TPA: cupredoxin domain-containing protein [Candidatus Limnocylindria bacterium]|nr:cupredoxin domain-containing protein [Candidatus Limnocylindria bacterium]
MAATFVALGAVIAACGGSGPSAGASTVPATTAPGTITVEATNYQFTPSAITAPAGPVTFSVKNAGTEEHEFEIFKGESVVDEIEGLVPGLTKNLTVNLEAGSYTFVCKLNGHDLLGMTGTLTVQ